MLRGRAKDKCPIAGCKSFWTRETSSLDAEFQYRLERFLSRKNTQQAFETEVNNLT